ncbi:MAG TPA: STAS domain-containing protein [Geminicoccus sp.]|jgi:anti-anti-sigma factor|uniref:STAS domain-containing protein n=1 Tax=Geminicoccus sp. TaxID=2024832 RepID=UPI002E351839|nr:STAS domain-containing protein [Geminicoccus sp.]HEX2525902.1 STAS domain-containing protein [Geminicoccus sp.]
MELSSALQDGIMVVAATGDLNATSCNQVETELTAQADAGHRWIVLDLGEVRYVSSAGLRVFLVSARKLAKAGAFVLARPTPSVAQILKMTGFDRIVQVEPSLEAAVATARAKKN